MIASHLSTAATFRGLFDGPAPFRQREVRPGQFVYDANDPATMVYLVESGEIWQYHVPAHAAPRLMDILGPNDWLGSAALARAEVYGMRAVAACNSILWECPADQIRQRMELHGDLAIQMVESLARRLQQANQDAGQWSTEDCRLRLLGTLIRFSHSPAAREVTGGVALRITHAQLAQAIGAARETISLYLAELRRLNLVKTGRNRLVFDPVQLQSLHDNQNLGHDVNGALPLRSSFVTLGSNYTGRERISQDAGAEIMSAEVPASM